MLTAGGMTRCNRYDACLKLREDELPCMDGMSMLYLRAGQPQLALPLLEKIAVVVAGAFSLPHLPRPKYHPAPPPLPLLSGSGGGALINLGIAYKNLRRYDDALRTYAKVTRGQGQRRSCGS